MSGKKTDHRCGSPVANNQDTMTAGPFENTARSIGPAPLEIQIRHIRNCLKADPAYGKGVADALGLTIRDVPAGDVESTGVGRGDGRPEAIQKAVSIIN